MAGSFCVISIWRMHWCSEYYEGCSLGDMAHKKGSIKAMLASQCKLELMLALSSWVCVCISWAMGSPSGRGKRLDSGSVYSPDLDESFRQGNADSNMSHQDIAQLSAPRLIPPSSVDRQLLLLSSSAVINFHIPEHSVISSVNFAHWTHLPQLVMDC